ncbi:MULTISPECIES: LysR substrate-binding domain-containing protein [Variovorax]|jgi:LysR family transcriptional regulator, glycine cleavage system transcriptional activator|uniref:LysR substrate-binding domain-containing protein n=1 Tax=Variovorax TaxID=34072 RepID=UPI00086F61E0|nr:MULTISPECIES: LysR substrate-binding domain-containing protein [Variovorax]MBN8756028.1 LysR family transcriptional regulator [Variovorax sp.]ODU11916.1 MAG: LysR family transcriptional regulator [Variovorax sp. SCN 67-85]ODV14722.1 MAG: LysR family transcriptional regulator [Variovorax sp. SCN 67-20]OJZ05564.1 MAG: LysR family transcriptional regulator [Variovorax sp. 67-131]UKI04980.1 LysR substrate-binding domain-containing protein [Variovorax paradoxus]
MNEIGSSIRTARRLPPLLSLRAFEAAAAHLSFQRAALELSVTPSAISHQVRALEDTLGQPLFRRLTRQLALTPAGQRLFDDLRMGFDVLEAGIDKLRRPAASQQVTLTTNTAFAARWVLPRMAAFRKACPGIELRLHASDTLVDLARGDADIAVRSGSGNWPGLTAHELMPERYAPMCSPMLRLERVADLPKQQLIHCSWQPHALAPALWPRWFKEAGVAPRHGRSTKAPSGLSFSDETHAMLAALGGHGVALLSLTLSAEELRNGALVRPFGPALDTGSYFLATANGREHEPAVRAVWEWIVSQAQGPNAPGPNIETGDAKREKASRRRP